MKVRVITKYRDLELKKIMVAGEEMEITKERAEHLINLGFVKKIEEKKSKKKNEPRED